MTEPDPAAPEPLVVHLIPYDGIGGVETAARTVEPGRYGAMRFDKLFIALKDRNGSPAGYRSENDPRAFVRAVRLLIARRPDVLVLSLWRSCLIGLIVKLLRPRTRLILFLHSSRDAHLVDRVVTRMTARVADEVWADSAATGRARLPRVPRSGVHAISFVAGRLKSAPRAPVLPAFIWWGRLHACKRVEAAIAIFAVIRRFRPDARFTIIGPDGGEEAALRRRAAELGLADAVRFAGPADRDAIARHAAAHSIFLQASAVEGMSMATVEAMQLGLVPLVAPAGEIAHYVEDGRNGLWIVDERDAASAALELVDDQPRYAAMRAAAIATWRERPLYRDSFLAACAAASRRRDGRPDGE